MRKCCRQTPSRARCRSASGEIHSGFSNLPSPLPLNLKVARKVSGTCRCSLRHRESKQSGLPGRRTAGLSSLVLADRCRGCVCAGSGPIHHVSACTVTAMFRLLPDDRRMGANARGGGSGTCGARRDGRTRRRVLSVLGRLKPRLRKPPVSFFRYEVAPMFQFIACLFNRHKPKKGADRWNGSMYVRVCEGCAADIVRRPHGSRWIRKSR